MTPGQRQLHSKAGGRSRKNRPLSEVCFCISAVKAWPTAAHIYGDMWIRGAPGEFCGKVCVPYSRVLVAYGYFDRHAARQVSARYGRYGLLGGRRIYADGYDTYRMDLYLERSFSSTWYFGENGHRKMDDERSDRNMALIESRSSGILHSNTAPSRPQTCARARTSWQYDNGRWNRSAQNDPHFPSHHGTPANWNHCLLASHAESGQA